MKSLFLCGSVLSCSLFLQSTDKFSQLPFAFFYSREPQSSVGEDTPSCVSAGSAEKSIKTQAICIPSDSRCSRQDIFFAWVCSQRLDKHSKAVKVDFARQYDNRKLEIPRGEIVQDGHKMIDPSMRFLYLLMDAEFKYDQASQMQTANSGRILSRRPLFRSLDEFNHFKFRKGGPKTLTVTKQGREILACLVVQYPEHSSLLARFAQDKKIAPDCLEKMKDLAISNIVRDGIHR